MWDGHSIAVGVGCELVVGTDPSCDVQITLPKLRIFGSHIVASRYNEVARVFSSANGVLFLSFSTRSLSIYIHGIHVVPSEKPIELLPGSLVSFGERHKRTTFCFFISDTSPAVSSPKRCAVLSPSALSCNSVMTPLQFPSFNAACGVTEEGLSPRSPRVVRITEATPHDGVGGNDGGGDESNRRLEVSPTSLSLLSGFKDSCELLSAHGKSVTTYDTPLKSNAVNNLPSSHTIAPFVVELWGARATLHSVIGRNACGGSDTTHSYGVAETSGRGTNTPGDPYFTSHGREMLRGAPLSRVETTVRSTAASVLESLEDAYEPDKGTFLKFTTCAKESLFQHFLLMADHALMELRKTPLTVRRHSPIVCCGDIHGSFSDLKTIFDNVVPFHHWSLMNVPVLFLGDYVDRGPHDVEVVLFLLAWYILCPEYLILLRGNHEDEEVNGDVQLYGDASFRKKCWNFFDKEMGDTFWRRTNDVFEQLPVIAIIDSTIFACHGGIPLLREKSLCEKGQIIKEKKWLGVCPQRRKQEEIPQREEQNVSDIAFMDDTPCVEFFKLLINGMPNELDSFRFRCMMPDEHDNDLTAQHRRLIRELLWNDPVPQFSRRTYENDGSGMSETEFAHHDVLDVNGFRPNIGRGDNRSVIREFSASALASFMQRWGFTLLIRAHQQKMAGVEMGLAGRILTLFSCCNYTGDTNRAGACIVVGGEVRLVSWRTAARATRDISSYESPCSSFDRNEEQQIPRYVGLEGTRFG